MPRFARLDAPGESFHIISRFVNREFRIRDEADRRAYLRFLERALSTTDWRLFAYGIMSSHLHVNSEQHADLLDQLLRSTHTSFAQYANRRDDRRGPVFLERASSILARGAAIGRTIAYIHNNPVRAGLVARASESDWTSHRAYLGLAPRPTWLAVERGLELAGFDDTPGGRSAFDEFVVEESKKSRDEQRQVLEGDRLRRVARRALKSPIELDSPIVDGDRVEFGIRAPGGVIGVRRLPPWEGDLSRLRAFAARTLGLDAVRATTREVARIHALALRVACIELGRPVGEVAAILGVAASTASGLLRSERRSARFGSEASAMAKAIRSSSR